MDEEEIIEFLATVNVGDFVHISYKTFFLNKPMEDSGYVVGLTTSRVFLHSLAPSMGGDYFYSARYINHLGISSFDILKKGCVSNLEKEVIS